MEQSITDLSLQLFLAKQLPEEIEIGGLAAPWEEPYFRWKLEPAIPVTPREWDYIVRRVEDRFLVGLPRISTYISILETLTYWKPRYIEAEDGKQYLVGSCYFSCITAPWQTRARALQQVSP